MSNTYYETDKIILTACVRNPQIMQLSLGKNDFIHLTKEEALEFAINILLRCNQHVSATGNEEGSYRLEQ